MSDKEYVQKTLDLYLGQVQELEKQIIAKKMMVNDLCRTLDRPPVFQGVEASASALTTRPDEYYGLPAIDVIRAILERRKSANLGAASISEIYKGMVEGGYQFKTQNQAHAKRGIYSIISSNEMFHKLPDNRTGLREWYPAARFETKLKNKKGKPHRGRGKPRASKKRATRIIGGSIRNTRLEQVRELLRTNGPMYRNEIREKADLPEGTVAYLLNRKNFRHLDDGKWALHDQKVT